MLQNNNSLREINLNNNYLGINCAYLISEVIRKNKILESIDLRYNNLGKEGCQIVFESLKLNSTLKNLQLGGNGSDLDTIKLAEKILEKNRKNVTNEISSTESSKRIELLNKINEEQESLSLSESKIKHIKLIHEDERKTTKNNFNNTFKEQNDLNYKAFYSPPIIETFKQKFSNPILDKVEFNQYFNQKYEAEIDTKENLVKDLALLR